MKRTAQLLTVLIVAQLMGCEGNDEWNSLLDAGDTYQSATMSDCIRYVDYNAEFGGTGLSWETAHESLVSAIESAERQDLTGCEIWISGDVVEDREVAVEQMNPQNAFHVYSGFRGNEHHRPNFANPVVLQTKDFARIRRGLNRFSSGADDGNVTQKDYEAIKALDVSPFHEVLADSSMMTPPSVTPLSGGTCGVCSGTQSIIGRLEVEGGSDANGTTNTGYIEIGNSLRLDSNEVITNSNTTLYLQNDNDGDLRVDNSTLMVDSSANRVGIGTTSPATTLHVNGKARATDIDVDG